MTAAIRTVRSSGVPLCNEAKARLEDAEVAALEYVRRLSEAAAFIKNISCRKTMFRRFSCFLFAFLLLPPERTRLSVRTKQPCLIATLLLREHEHAGGGRHTLDQSRSNLVQTPYISKTHNGWVGLWVALRKHNSHLPPTREHEQVTKRTTKHTQTSGQTNKRARTRASKATRQARTQTTEQPNQQPNEQTYVITNKHTPRFRESWAGVRCHHVRYD